MGAVRAQHSAGKLFRQLARLNPCERGPSQQQHCFRGITARALPSWLQADGLLYLRVQLALVVSSTKWTWNLGKLWLASFRQSQWLLRGWLLQKPLRPEFLRPGFSRLDEGMDATMRLHCWRSSEALSTLWCEAMKPRDAVAPPW